MIVLYEGNIVCEGRECHSRVAGPLSTAVAFALSRGADGCDPAELRAFLGGTHPERVTTYLANLQGVLQLNTLGRLTAAERDALDGFRFGEWQSGGGTRVRVTRVSSAHKGGLRA